MRLLGAFLAIACAAGVLAAPLDSAAQGWRGGWHGGYARGGGWGGGWGWRGPGWGWRGAGWGWGYRPAYPPVIYTEPLYDTAEVYPPPPVVTYERHDVYAYHHVVTHHAVHHTHHARYCAVATR